jgi:hypothetical protein
VAAPRRIVGAAKRGRRRDAWEDRGMSGPESSAPPVVVIVDVANVMGSRPDGWWRDRAGAATRLLERMPPLVGRMVDGPDGEPLVLARVVAVLLAPADGDGTIAATAAEVAADGEAVLVVTADRGLRARLPDGAVVAGPGWLNALLGR